MSENGRSGRRLLASGVGFDLDVAWPRALRGYACPPGTGHRVGRVAHGINPGIWLPWKCRRYSDGLDGMAQHAGPSVDSLIPWLATARHQQRQKVHAGITTG